MLTERMGGSVTARPTSVLKSCLPCGPCGPSAQPLREGKQRAGLRQRESLRCTQDVPLLVFILILFCLNALTFKHLFIFFIPLEGGTRRGTWAEARENFLKLVLSIHHVNPGTKFRSLGSAWRTSPHSSATSPAQGNIFEINF